MVYKFKKYLSFFWQIRKSDIMSDMAYPLPFLFKFGTIIFLMFLNIIFINTSFNYIENLSGWNYFQVLGVVGAYTLIDGIMWVLFAQLNAFNNLIKNGDLDWILLKPIDAQFLVSVWRGDIEDLARCVAGLGMVFIALKNTIGFTNVLNIFLFFVLIIFGTMIIYSLNIFVRSISFWTIDATGAWFMMERITSNSQFPIDIYYHKIVRNTLTFIIPLAFIATVPAKILTNVEIDWKLVGLSLLMATLFFLGSRMFWKFSLKHYSSASS